MANPRFLLDLCAMLLAALGGGRTENRKTDVPWPAAEQVDGGHQLSNRLYFEVQALALLKAADDLEKIARLRIALRAEHSHQAFGRLRGNPPSS